MVLSLSGDLAALGVTGLRAATSIGFLRLATLLVAQSFDLATFSLMVARHGTIAEANPIVVDLFVSYGMPAVVLAKAALVVLVGALSVAAWSQRGGTRVWAFVGGLPLAIAIAFGLIGGITNTANLLP